MTGASLAQALVEHGLQPSDHAGKVELFDLVLGGHMALNPSGRTEAHAWWVPGRLEVFGKHTDYAGGRTLVCAVPRGFAVIASARADGVVNVVDARNDESLTLRPPFDEAFAGWRNYVRVVARRLSRNFPESALGADIVFASDLPRASGMSSSSALMISVAAVLARIGALERREEWSANIRSPLDVAGYYACIENGLSFGSLQGDSGVGHSRRQRRPRRDSDRPARPPLRLSFRSDACECDVSRAGRMVLRVGAKRCSFGKDRRREGEIQPPLSRHADAARGPGTAPSLARNRSARRSDRAPMRSVAFARSFSPLRPTTGHPPL